MKEVSHPGTLGLKKDEDILRDINAMKCRYCGDVGKPTENNKCASCGSPKYVKNKK